MIGRWLESLAAAGKSRLQLNGAGRMRNNGDGRREGRAASIYHRSHLRRAQMLQIGGHGRPPVRAPLEVCPGHDLQDQHIRGSTADESAPPTRLPACITLHAAQMPQLRRCGGASASALSSLSPTLSKTTHPRPAQRLVDNALSDRP